MFQDGKNHQPVLDVSYCQLQPEVEHHNRAWMGAALSNTKRSAPTKSEINKHAPCRLAVTLDTRSSHKSFTHIIYIHTHGGGTTMFFGLMTCLKPPGPLKRAGNFLPAAQQPLQVILPQALVVARDNPSGLVPGSPRILIPFQTPSLKWNAALNGHKLVIFRNLIPLPGFVNEFDWDIQSSVVEIHRYIDTYIDTSMVLHVCNDWWRTSPRFSPAPQRPSAHLSSGR